MRPLAIALAVLLAAIQWPLWFGKGGWLRVADLERQVTAQRAANDYLAARNAQLAAEVASFRTGREAVEERARMQLNMIRGDELFFQFVPASSGEKPAAQP
ncbi:MAG: cell division protein FtsB [Gemmatimonadota bacterium]